MRLRGLPNLLPWLAALALAAAGCSSEGPCERLDDAGFATCEACCSGYNCTTSKHQYL